MSMRSAAAKDSRYRPAWPSVLILRQNDDGPPARCPPNCGGCARPCAPACANPRAPACARPCSVCGGLPALPVEETCADCSVSGASSSGVGAVAGTAGSEAPPAVASAADGVRSSGARGVCAGAAAWPPARGSLLLPAPACGGRAPPEAGGAAEGGESATLAGASSKTASATSSAMARPSASARSRRPSSSVTGPPADARPAERPAPAASFPSLCSVGVRVAAGGDAHAREPAAEGVGRAVGGVCCDCDARDGRSAVSSLPGRRPMSEEDVCSIVDTRAAIQSTLSTSRFRRAMTSR